MGRSLEALGLWVSPSSKSRSRRERRLPPWSRCERARGDDVSRKLRTGPWGLGALPDRGGGSCLVFQAWHGPRVRCCLFRCGWVCILGDTLGPGWVDWVYFLNLPAGGVFSNLLHTVSFFRRPGASASLRLTSTSWQPWNKQRLPCGTGQRRVCNRQQSVVEPKMGVGQEDESDRKTEKEQTD